jgi:essential nuclear protein 1
MPAATSARVLKEARAQQDEVRAEAVPLGAQDVSAALAAAAEAAGGDSSSDDDDDLAGGAWGGRGTYGAPGGPGGGGSDEEEEHEDVSPEDEAALAAFMAPGAAEYQQRTLADVIMDKIRERQEATGLQPLARCVRRDAALRAGSPAAGGRAGLG